GLDLALDLAVGRARVVYPAGLIDHVVHPRAAEPQRVAVVPLVLVAVEEDAVDFGDEVAGREVPRRDDPVAMDPGGHHAQAVELGHLVIDHRRFPDGRRVFGMLDDVTKLRRIGVLTGGGDAPGLNPAIRAVVYRAAEDGIDVAGIYDGW